MNMIAATNSKVAAGIGTATATSAIGYSNGILYVEHDAYNDDDIENENAEDDDDYDEGNSLASMETLSDNVSIWVDGEKHWISGVDANTTCADLICALLNYQDGQPMACNAAGGNGNGSGGDSRSPPCTSSERNASNVINNINKRSSNIEKNNGNNAINQSTTSATNTKEDYTSISNSSKSKTAATAATTATTAAGATASAAATATGGAAIAATTLACGEYVIVKQHRHCEEYLDGSTKVFDVLPARDMPARKEYDLLLRRLASSPSHHHQIATQVASLLSTDKDSGMGSPVGSSRSARFRRRNRHKSSSWLAQGNTLHPKLSQRSNNSNSNSSSNINSNERLVKIILAQDETIHRQLTLLREKEVQISKIEEEKHRVRERELGKNYLLETYLNGLDEADMQQPELENGVEIFIDEPYHRYPPPTTKTTKSHRHRHHKQHMQKQHGEMYCIPSSGIITKSTTSRLPAMLPIDELDGGRATVPSAGSPKEIELQIMWLEKVYAINKQLQREEELLLKLHAKIRKHQVKRAYQTKKEVLQQIDKLDTELTLQCVDIRQIEDNLVTSNEQLKEKLCVLEKLSEEFTATMEDDDDDDADADNDAVAVTATVAAGGGGGGGDGDGGANDGNSNFAITLAVAVAADDAKVENNDIKLKSLETTCNPHQLNYHQQQPDEQHLNHKKPQQREQQQIVTSMDNDESPMLMEIKQPNKVFENSIQAQQQMLQKQQHQHTLNLNNKMSATQDFLKLQKIIAKPMANAAATTVTKTVVTVPPATPVPTPLLLSTAILSTPSLALSAAATARASPLLFIPPTKATTTAKSSMFWLPQQQQQQQQQSLPHGSMLLLPHNNYPISRINHYDDVGVGGGSSDNGNTGKHCAAIISTTNRNTMQQQQQQQQHQQQQQPQHQHSNKIIIDKNVLLPLHVNDEKTVQKQMFGPKSLNQMMSTTATSIKHRPHSNDNANKNNSDVDIAVDELGINYVAGSVGLMSPSLALGLDSTNVDITRLGTLV